jgi:hypothetical protein
MQQKFGYSNKRVHAPHVNFERNQSDRVCALISQIHLPRGRVEVRAPKFEKFGTISNVLRVLCLARFLTLIHVVNVVASDAVLDTRIAA